MYLHTAFGRTSLTSKSFSSAVNEEFIDMPKSGILGSDNRHNDGYHGHSK
jgi:hypothetical protein